MSVESVRRHAIVSGEVQGVGFRMSARAQALHLGLSGFARNLPDGRVEVEAEGPDDAVAALLSWLQSGPTWAVVAGVEVSDREVTGVTGFEVS